MDGDILGQVLAIDTQIRFGLEKRHTKVYICGSKTSPNYHMLFKKIIILHQGFVRSLFLYIDFHVGMFLKEINVHVRITIKSLVPTVHRCAKNPQKVTLECQSISSR